MINLDKLKQLREQTGVSFSLCKKALEEEDNDLKKAIQLLSKWGHEKATAKSGRQTKEGAIFSYVHHNKKVGVLVELLCETDFVARNEDFLNLGKELVLQIASTNPQTVEELMDQEYIKDPSKKVDTLFKDLILKIGENIAVGRFIRYAT